MNEPHPPREAALVERARESLGLSVRKAAQKAGISEARWRQIAKGYTKVKADVSVPAVAPAATLAAMALAVGVTPSQLREVDRSDAAQILEVEVQGGGGWSGDLSEVPDDALLGELERRLRSRAETDGSVPPLQLVARRVDSGDASTFGGAGQS